jgi:hypothetical protein
VVACAGQALAQPVVDGTKDAIYGEPLWVNTITTGFGDGTFTEPCVPDVDLGGDPAAVTTGMEFSIPLASLGTAAGQPIGMVAFIANGGYNFLSNQVLPGLPFGTPNLAAPGGVNFGSFAGDQHVFFTPSVIGTAPVMDGTLDASYGAPLALQTARTGFGDSNSGNPAISNGSELNGMYAVVSGDRLYVMLTGNQESNFNKLVVLFDTIAGGQNTMAGNNIDVDFNGLNAMAGLTFDTGFAADYWIGWGSGNGGGAGEYYPNYARLRPSPEDAGSGGFQYCDVPGNGIATTCGDNLVGMESDINHSNTGGVAGAGSNCPIPGGTELLANGSELNAIYAYVDACTNRLYVMVTGNLQNESGTACSNGGNKMMVFFDANGAAEGQNLLRSDNLPISFNALRNMAGMTFDEGFFADYWMLVKMYRDSGSQNMDVSVLRADGPTINGIPVDYGAFDGGDPSLPAYNPVTFSGNNPCDPTAGTDPDPFNNDNVDRYTSFAPRAVYNDLIDQATNGAPFPITPVGTPGLITFDVNNSNVGGVQGTGGTVTDAANVTTGFEISVDLDELGWDGVSAIKMVAMITGIDGSFLSNQVVGLQGQQNNISAPVADGGLELLAAQVNFSDELLFPGLQHVSIEVGTCGPTCPPCAADYDNNGGVDGGDLGAFFSDFEAGETCADVDGNGGVDGGDLGFFFAVFEAGGC